MSKQHGGKRAGAGRPPHSLGVGVKVTVRIPEKLVEALKRDSRLDEVTFSQALVARVRRGRKRGRTGL